MTKANLEKHAAKLGVKTKLANGKKKSKASIARAVTAVTKKMTKKEMVKDIGIAATFTLVGAGLARPADMNEISRVLIMSSARICNHLSGLPVHTVTNRGDAFFYAHFMSEIYKDKGWIYHMNGLTDIISKTDQTFELLMSLSDEEMSEYDWNTYFTLVSQAFTPEDTESLRKFNNDMDNMGSKKALLVCAKLMATSMKLPKNLTYLAHARWLLKKAT